LRADGCPRAQNQELNGFFRSITHLASVDRRIGQEQRSRKVEVRPTCRAEQCRFGSSLLGCTADRPVTFKLVQQVVLFEKGRDGCL